MHFIAVPYTFSYGITSTQLLRFYMILESGLFLSRIRRGMGKNGSQVSRARWKGRKIGASGTVTMTNVRRSRDLNTQIDTNEVNAELTAPPRWKLYRNTSFVVYSPGRHFFLMTINSS